MRAQAGREIVVRVAGLPAAVPAELRLPHTAGSVARLTGERRRLMAEAAALSDVLFDLIGDPAPGRAGSGRAALVGLRRALAPGHRPPSARLIEQCALPEPVAARVDAWLGARRDWDTRRAELDEVLAKERADALDRIRAACAAPEFRRGLPLSSGELSATLDRWLADPGRVPRRGKVLRLVKYLVRASAKTSPFGSFMVGAFACPEGSGTGAPDAITVMELPGAFLDAVRDALLADPRQAHRVRLRPNPSLHELPESYLFVQTRCGERIALTPRKPAVDLCLRLARSRPTAPRLARLLAEHGADPGEAGGFVSRLVAAQLLVPCSPVADDDPDPFMSWSRWAAGGGDAPEPAGALLELSAAMRPVPASHDDHRRRRARAAGATAAVAAALGIEPPAEPAHEAEVSAHRPAPPRLSAGVLADLDAVRRWLTVFDWKVPVRLEVGAYCRTQFGSGSRTPFLEVCRQATAALPHLFGPAAMPWFADLTGSPRLRALARLRERARSLARSPAPAVTLDRGQLLADIADWPAWLTPPGSAGFYLQTLPGAVVINSVHAGHGRAPGRLHHLLARAGVAPERPVREGLPVAEFGGRFGSALNTRTPSTRYEIDLPGAASARDDTERIPLGELIVAHDPESDLVSLHSDRLGRVDPVHLGMLGELALPAVAGFLERVFAPTYLFHPSVPPLISPRDLEGAAGTRRFPRVRAGDVVVQRARWTVPAGQVPRRRGTDGDHLLALAAWRHAHGIPERCFVRGWTPGATFGKARKPLYVDFASWHLVALFERAARGNAALVIDEALPDPLADGGPAHVTEYHVEVFAEGASVA